MLTHEDRAAPRILVVDDSAFVRQTVADMLASEGFTVRAVDSGEAAFEACLTQPFDVVVTDLTMGALSGVQLCRLLRSDPATAKTPVVMLTASNNPKSRFWGRNAGADAYLTKESVGKRLVPTIQDLLGREGITREEAVIPRGRYTKPLERLSEVLDDLLFQAVVASEVRRMIEHVSDRGAFCQAVIELAAEVTSYAYLALRLDGPAGTTTTIHARSPFPASPTPKALSALGLEGAPETVDLVADGETLPERESILTGEMAYFGIEAGGERLGALHAYGGGRRLSGVDRRTFELCAREIAITVKTLFLMEQTRLVADTDSLTGVPNRRRCSEQLAHEVARARRQKSPLTVAVCDLDHFKAVNDTYGHNVGDVVLQHLAATLKTGVRTIDMVGRWGGEEFLVILPNASTPGGRVVAERLRSLTEAGTPPEGPKRITLSIGIATWQPQETPEQLVERADKALYRAKERGRNRVEVAPEGISLLPHDRSFGRERTTEEFVQVEMGPPRPNGPLPH